jgi:hypothetical protein
VVDVVQKHTLEYLQGIQEQVKTLLPQAFPGENIKKFGVAILVLAKPLTNAGKYPQELTLSVITNLLTGGGDTGHVGHTGASVGSRQGHGDEAGAPRPH